MTPPCEVCGRSHGERRPRCIRCADTPRGRLLPEPLPGRYLAIDPGKRCGYAIVQARAGMAIDRCESGECEVWGRTPEQVVLRARISGCEAMIIESPGLGPSLPPAAVYGLGRAAGVWEWLWRTTATADTRSVILEVPGITWRATVIGGPQRSTEEWKADAKAHIAREMDYTAGPEEADALCLAEHALHSLDLADAVGVRRLAKLGWAEPRGCWVKGRWRAA